MIPHIPDQRKLIAPGGRPFNDLVKYITQEGQTVFIDKLKLEGGDRSMANFSDIVNYATGQTERNKNKDKCIGLRTHGVHDISTASAEMNAVAVQNLRCVDPAYHFILSWPEHERPHTDKIFDSAVHALTALGLSEHQYVLAVHGDTDNVHCHVSVNRVHPITFRSRNIEWATKTLHLAARQSEIKHGWSHDNGIYIVKVDGRGRKTIVLNPENAAGLQKTSPHADRDFEPDLTLPTWHDPDGLDSWMKSTVAKALKRVLPDLDGWPALHAWLEKYDILLNDAGGGGMRLHATSPETGEVLDLALSKGLRALKRNELERRWGKFTNKIQIQDSGLDLSHLTSQQIYKGIEDVLSRTLDTSRPPPHVLGRSAHLGRPPDNITRSAKPPKGTSPKEDGGMHELPAGSVDATGPERGSILPHPVHGRLGDIEAGQYNDVRRAGTSKIGGRGESRDALKREERKQARAAARADLRERFSAYKRFVRAGDTEHFIRIAEAKQERSKALKDLRARAKAAKASVAKLEPGARLLLIVGIEAERLRDALQVESRFQQSQEVLRSTRVSPLGWREWLHEQSNVGDQAALSALRGIVYQAQRDAKREGLTDTDTEIVDATDVAKMQEAQFRKVMARLLDEEKAEIAIRGARIGQMRPHEIDSLIVRHAGIKWHVTGNGNVEYSNQDGGHLFTDRGSRVTFDRKIVTDDDIRMALAHSGQKFGRALTLTGDDAIFTARMACLADDMGIVILNPELRAVIEAHRSTNSISRAVKAPMQTAPIPSASRAAPLRGDAHPDKVPASNHFDKLQQWVMEFDALGTFEEAITTNSHPVYIGPILAGSPHDDEWFVQQLGASRFVVHHGPRPGYSSERPVELAYVDNEQKIRLWVEPQMESQLSETPDAVAGEQIHELIFTVPDVGVSASLHTDQQLPPLKGLESAHSWAATWAFNNGKTIAPPRAEMGTAAYMVVFVGHDGVVVDQGRTGAVYTHIDRPVLSAGDRVTIGQDARLHLWKGPEQGIEQSR